MYGHNITIMKIVIKPKDELINAGDILQRFSQEEIIMRYTGLSFTKKAFKSPFREDKKPSCIFYYTANNYLVLKDLTGVFSGGWIEVAAKYYRITEDGSLSPNEKRDVIKLVYNDLCKDVTVVKKKVEPKIITRSFYELEYIKDNWGKADLHYWGSHGFDFDVSSEHIKCEFLEKANVAPIKVGYVNNIYRPELGNSKTLAYIYEHLLDDGQVAKQLYRPLDPAMKWRMFLPKTESKLIFGLCYLDDSKHHILTSSYKDALCITNVCNKLGLPIDSYSFPSEGIVREVLPKTFMYIGDNDPAGLEAAKRLKSVNLGLYTTIPAKLKDFAEYCRYDFQEASNWLEREVSSFF